MYASTQVISQAPTADQTLCQVPGKQQQSNRVLDLKQF